MSADIDITSLSSCDACNTVLFRVSEQDSVSSARLSRDAYAAIRQLKTLYPGFAEWYYRLFSRDGSLYPDREILVSMNEGIVAGVAILKRSEQKICTLYVVDGFRGESVGSELVEASFEILNSDKPLITVGDSVVDMYDGLFRQFGFSAEQCLHGIYDPSHDEYVFNGSMFDKCE